MPTESLRKFTALIIEELKEEALKVTRTYLKSFEWKDLATLQDAGAAFAYSYNVPYNITGYSSLQGTKKSRGIWCAA